MKNIELAAKYENYIVEMRRYFHENPELSNQEHNTVATIAAQLDDIGIPYVIVENGGILATVKGDIHDIGKNIVKVLLESYGFTVIDLGKDVAPEVIVEAAIKHQVKLVGLSALMTTTLKSMADTVALLNEKYTDCKTVVGGAVLTEAYAKQIHADFYAKDAKQAVDIASEIYT